MDPYVYASNDYGETWDRIGRDLPLGPVNVIREDPRNSSVLYVGTDQGIFVSIDGGESFSPMGSEIPGSPVHDLRVQPRERDLIAATHGRSIYVADISHIQDLDDDILSSPLFVFRVDSVEFDEDWGDRPGNWKDPVEPEVKFDFYAAEDGVGWVFVLDEFDHVMAEIEIEAERGLNFVAYDMSTCPKCLKVHRKSMTSRARAEGLDLAADETPNLEPRDNGKVYLPPGAYTVKMKLNGAVERIALVIKE
jgi:hypothetical protein